MLRTIMYRTFFLYIHYVMKRFAEKLISFFFYDESLNRELCCSVVVSIPAGINLYVRNKLYQFWNEIQICQFTACHKKRCIKKRTFQFYCPIFTLLPLVGRKFKMVIIIFIFTSFKSFLFFNIKK